MKLTSGKHQHKSFKPHRSESKAKARRPDVIHKEKWLNKAK